MARGKTVYVITDSEGGWDCVRGIYEDEEEAKADAKEVNGENNDYPYLIHEKTLYEKPK